MSLSGQNRMTKEEAIPETSDSKNKEKVPLSKQILKMLDCKEFSDITLIIDGKEIYCHRTVLSSRSTYFKAMFSHDFKESDKTRITLKSIPSYTLFYSLIEFMYSDSLKINIKNIFDMLSLADEYGVSSYKEKAEILLSKYITVNTV